MVFQPGFNSLVGVIEHDAESGIDTSIIDNGFNKAKLFCNLDKPSTIPSTLNGPEPEVPQPPPAGTSTSTMCDKNFNTKV